MVTLRATYADDVSKLTMMAEAHRVLDAVRTRHEESAGEPVDVAGELRAARARLAEATAYLAGIEGELPQLRVDAERAHETQARAAAEVDTATAHAVTPFLAQRDALARRREDAAAAMQRAAGGLGLVHALERRAVDIARAESTIAGLREELAAVTAGGPRPDRSSVVAAISRRFAAILRELHYPKLADAHLADDLTPYVRGEPYTAASSGARTLIALAWQLALFEVAWETRSSHPGFLLLDSPQKNLAQAGFADRVTIERTYQHLRGWLGGRGAGAQIVVADNAPPPDTDDDVIVRFTRRADQAPYGLIDDDTG